MLTTSLRCAAILALGVLLRASVVCAEDGADSRRAELGHERADAQLSVSGVKLDGSQSGGGYALGYDGWSYDDLALLLRIFGTSPVGGLLDVRRQAFSLLAGKDQVLQGSQLELAVAPTARVHAGPLTFALALGYQYQQLADFAAASPPQWTPAGRSSVFGDLRISASFGVGGVEAFARYPFALATSAPGVSAPKSTGWSAGGALLFNLFEATPLLFRAGVRYQHEQDTLTGTGGFAAAQTQNEFGLVIDAAWLGPKAEEALVGSLSVGVHDAAGTPLGNAHLSLVLPSGEHRESVSAPDGTASFLDLKPGRYSVDGALADFTPGSGGAEVVAGQRAQVELTLSAVPKVGSLKVTVLDAESKQPAARAQAKVGGTLQPTDADGSATFADLKPGNYAIAVLAPGHKPAQEAAAVVAGRETDVEVKLLKLQEAALATLSGILRNVSGRPIAATLDIPEARLHIRAGADGRFSVRVPQGMYRVVISAPGYLTQAKTVSLKPGDQAIFNVDLHPVRP